MRDPLTILGLDRKPGAPFVLTTKEAVASDVVLRRAAAMGNRLLEMGCGGGRAVVSLDSGPDFVVGLAGCWMSGVTPVLLDPLVRKELLGAIQMTGAGAVICGARCDSGLPVGVRELVPDQTEAAPLPAPKWTEDAPLLFLFTSGSTGKPVLVPKTFSQLDVEVSFLRGLFSEPKHVATLVPWCHIFGLLTSLLVPARTGGVCDLSAGISPKRVLEKAGQDALDLVVAVPAVYQVMVRYLEASNLHSIAPRCRFTSSGAPLPAPLRTRFTELTGRPITDLYGSTEAGGVAYRHDEGPWIVEPHVEMRVTDEGFLEVRSASVSFPGPDGFYRIGDLVRPEGRGFTLIGRADDVVKIGGRRTSLGEVAEALESCPGVFAAAVLAKRIRGALRLVAYIESASEGVEVQAVKHSVRGLLADHKVPREIHIVERLPRTTAGKVDRQKLAGILHEGE